MQPRRQEEGAETPQDHHASATFAARLKGRRLARGWTQEELADRAGVSVSTISKLERGAPRRLHQETLRLLVTALGLAAEESADFVALGRGHTDGAHQGPLIPSHLPSPAPNPARGNLPMPPTALLGRDEDLTRVLALLAQPEIRLLTLVGPGGSGKTRLALEAARRVSGHYHDGVFLVSLAPVRDPSLVMTAIADALEIQERGSNSLQELLSAYLTDKHLLLLLDNFEHLSAAAPQLAALLERSQQLQLLVTSRTALRIRAEQVFPVPPLALPDLRTLPPLVELARIPAVELFLERARAAAPGFELTERNAATLAAICCRLDGLPLAIELAAPLVRVLSPAAMLERLAHRLDVLVDGPPDLPERQRSLGATLAWGYELLGPREQWLFRQLAVFAGGAPLEAIEAVCVTPAMPQGALITSLAVLSASSLLSSQVTLEGGTRITQLETVREYGWHCLVADGEAAAARERHAAYYLQFAEEAAVQGQGSQQLRWLARLDEEHNNLRAALSWSLAQQNVTTGLRLASALRPFWHTRGHVREGRRWLEEMLALASPEEDGERLKLRANACNSAGVLAQAQGDFAAALAWYEQALALSQQTQNQHGIANAYHNLGIVAQEQGDLGRARHLYRQCLPYRRALGDRHGEAATLNGLGIVARLQGDLVESRRWHAAALAIRREDGDQRAIASSLNNLGNLSVQEGCLERAAELFGEALAVWRGLQDRGKAAIALDNLAYVAHLRRDYVQASALAAEAVTIRRELGDTAGLAMSLIILATIAGEQDDLARAADLARQSLALCRAMDARIRTAECLERLAYVDWKLGNLTLAAQRLGHAAALREVLGVPIESQDRVLVETAKEDVHRQLGHERFLAEWTAGQEQSLEQVIAQALDEDGARR